MFGKTLRRRDPEPFKVYRIDERRGTIAFVAEYATKPEAIARAKRPGGHYLVSERRRQIWPEVSGGR